MSEQSVVQGNGIFGADVSIVINHSYKVSELHHIGGLFEFQDSHYFLSYWADPVSGDSVA